MRRRKTGRDGFQGWSPSSAAAWDRIFGGRPTEPPVSSDARFWEPAARKSLREFYDEAPKKDGWDQATNPFRGRRS
jgi:hypothetical protein